MMYEDSFLDERFNVESAEDFIHRNCENIDDIERLMLACNNCGEFRPRREIINNRGKCNLCSNNDFREARAVHSVATRNMRFFYEE